MELAEAYLAPVIIELCRRLLERDYAQADPEVVMLTAILTNILWHDHIGDRPTEVLILAALGEEGVLNRPSLRVMRWRSGTLSGSYLAHDQELGTERKYQSREMPRPGLRRRHRAIHEEMTSEAGLSSSQLKVAVPPKRAIAEERRNLDKQNDGRLNGEKRRAGQSEKKVSQNSRRSGHVEKTV